MTPENALDALNAEADEARAAKQKSHFGASNTYIGIAPGRLEEMARAWRKEVSFPERLELANALWMSGVFDARLMAAKLLTQARIKDDQDVWAHITDWLAQAGTWAEIDALCSAGQRRLAADNSRINKVYKLMRHEEPLQRRAALGLTEFLAKAPHPSEREVIAIDRICEWLPDAIADESKDVHRTAQSWLRSLSKHDYKRARAIYRGPQEDTEPDALENDLDADTSED
ncbi:MAG: DNA alkylation repair protein [Pacificibacter sp.]|uniref:DNA alkylation repair protein n=1 Tax=Pacificibacter sp. TaxID=1917866 RepID=UPI0032191A30